MTSFKEAGFTIADTGGGATAWFKDIGDNGAHILITDSGGLSHELANGDDSYIVGVHWDLPNGDAAWSDCLDAKTDSEALEAAKVIELAFRFSRLLLDDIGAANLATVIERNAANVNPSVCHSHDFCDANMTMLTAWQVTFSVGVENGPAFMTGDSEMADSDLERWNRAWAFAKGHKFFTESRP